MPFINNPGFLFYYLGLRNNQVQKELFIVTQTSLTEV
jgi:hypothetical protein